MKKVDEDLKYKIAIIGSRDFNDYELLKKVMLPYEPYVINIISGGARGADKLAERYAQEKKMSITIYHPLWDLFGKRAGFMRNQKIVDDADMVIAFWDGESKGTKHSITLCKTAGKPCHVHKFSKNEGIF